MKAKLANLTSPELEDLVDLVSISQPVVLNPDSTNEYGEPKPRLGALDCGIKYNILRSLCQHLKLFGVLQICHLISWSMSFKSMHCFALMDPGDPAISVKDRQQSKLWQKQ